MRKFILILVTILAMTVPSGAVNWIRSVDIKSGLRENYVCDIISDDRGLIYIATKLGIDIFDGNTLRQLPVDYPALCHPERICFDRKGGLWGVWKDSLWLYDGRGFTNDPAIMKKRAKASGFVLPPAGISDLYTQGGRLAYITPDGSLCYTDNTKHKAARYPALAGRFRRLSLGRDGKVWLFDGMKEGLAYVDFSSHRPASVSLDLFKDIIVRDVECTPGGRVLVATNNDGMFVLDSHGNLVDHHRHKVSDPQSIPSDHISTIMVRNGYLFAGTTKKGVQIAQIHPLGVTCVNTGIDADISFMREDADGRLFIGFDGDGLCIYPTAGDTTPLRHFTKADSPLPSDLVIGMSSGPGNPLFSTYGGGIFALDNGSPTVVYDSDSLRFCRHIVRLPGGEVIAATFDHGLAVVGHKMLTYENSPLQTNSITCLATLGKRVAVGSATGLYIYDPVSMSIIPPKIDKLKDMLVLDLHVDRHGFVWIGSTDGLTVLNQRLEPVAEISRRNHLSNNFIKAICSDRNGNVWVTTANGINHIVVKRAADDRLDFSCTPYFEKDGIGDIDFDRHSITCLSDGRILAGGQGKYIIIDPSTAGHDRSAAKVYPGRLLVDGKEIAPGDKVRLDYYHSFTIELTTFNPEGDRNNVFEYRFDDDDFWNTAEGPVINISSLSPGRHVMYMREAQSGTENSIEIEVAPPFWRTWWAYTLYCTAAAALIFMLIRYIRARYRKKLYKAKVELALQRGENMTPSPDEIFISKVRNLIEEHMAEDDFSVESLSELMSMSRSNLYKKISKATGSTPVEFIRTIRLRKGKMMLDAGETSISQIAYTVGMSPKFFSKSFKEEYGVTPSKYVPSSPDASVGEE